MTRKVDRLSCIRFGSARYSVPTRLIGARSGVRADHDRLLAIMTATGEIVAEHILVAPGEARCAMSITAAAASAPPGGAPKTAARKSSARSARSPRRSSPGRRVGQHPPRPRAGRAEHAARRARRPSVPRGAGPGGRVQPVAAPRTSGRSWPPHGTPDPRPAGEALVLELPGCRSGRWPTTRSAALS